MNPNVLLVDDDKVILESLTDILMLSEFQVTTATNGVEALQVLREVHPDIIVSDVMMPEMNGYELFEQIRSNPQWTTIPFIFLSARCESEHIMDAYKLGADHYITKPFDPEALLILVKSRLQRVEEVRSVLQRQFQRQGALTGKTLEANARESIQLVSKYLEIYQREKERLSPSKAEKMSRIVARTLDRMVRLFEDLMLITYIDSGSVQVEIQYLYQDMDLVEELRSVFGMLKDIAADKEVSIVPFMPESLNIFAHTHFTRDIFYRLIENAIKFNQHGGNVWVEVEELKENVMVSIRDEGMGISNANMQAYFSHLNDPERVKIEKQGGGLGLPIASRLIRLHGGEIKVESTLGKGSTFTAIMPINLGAD